MSFLKKGPDLKLSELKVPDFLYDLYYDLKERHLLPLVAVLAVSIVVVPLALSRTTGSSSEGEEGAAVATPSAVQGEASDLAVARSAPGLRDYRRRLRDAHALDPFRAASNAAAGSEASEGASGSEAPAAAEASEPSSFAPVEAPAETVPPVSYPSEPEGSGTTTVTKTETETKYASQTVDVRIVTVTGNDGGARASAKPSAKVRHGLPELTMLPSRATPAAVFMGTSSDGKKALFLVSSDVQSIFGDGRCIVGSQTCQLLALEEGVPETFVYGPKARTYRIEILKIAKTLSSKPRKAALGEAKEKGAGRVSSAQPR